ncbi:hypothetical protein F2Q68_00033599 [Brassica cretica]|uniref:Uncharacterized protein n=1 Tax=Brassica cretica TaxID=69181 RepID=A0A8S9HBD7_BRACR|nr:hypothetical protein F2Q68_00033599 [Brassica cretica]
MGSKSTCSVQFNLTKPVIFSYNQVEVLSKIISVPLEVLLDAPPGSLENCPEARGGSVRVQISLSRPISFYMVKPRLCPSQDQSSPFQSSHPLGFGQVFSDQRAAYRQRTLGFKETPYSLDREHSERRDHGPWLSGYTDGVVTGSDPTVLGLSRGHGVNFVTLIGSSLARHVALPDHGVGLDGQSRSCLIVGWSVGLSSPTLGAGRPSVMFLFDCWPVGQPMLRTVRGCYTPYHTRKRKRVTSYPED